MQQRNHNQPPSYLFNKYVLLVLLALLLVAAWFKVTVVVILLGLVLATAVLTRVWSWLSLKEVSFERKISDTRAFPGESIELQLKITNNKILPLFWIQIEDEIPLIFNTKTQSTEESRPGYGKLSKSTPLLWYSSATWREQLTCNKRGYYKLGPLSVTSVDIFGFYPRTATRNEEEHIIVYPVIYPIREMDIPPLYPVGDTKAERRIFTDPSRVIGIREYNPHDSLRHIHWKATARHQELQVKIFEPTTTQDIAIFLAVDSFKEQGNLSTDDFELGISTAASIASHIISEQKSSAGLFVNTKQADSQLPARILPGGGTKQLINILEALAKTTSIPDIKFIDFIQNELKSLPWGTTIILILGQTVYTSTAYLIEHLNGLGYKTTVLHVGTGNSVTDSAPLPSGFYKVTKPGDLAGAAL